MRRIALIVTAAVVLFAVPAWALDPGQVALVTQATNGAPAALINGADMSANGRCVVFDSLSDTLPGQNGSFQIYLRDTVANTTSLVSVANGSSTGGDGDSRFPSITPDCRYVAWDSQASNLTATAQTERLAYRRDLQSGATIIVSRATGAGGALPNAAATTPVMSANGNRVVFSTFAGNLSALDQDGGAHNDLFVRDVNAATTELVTQNTAGQGQDGSQGAGFYPSISNDGSRVAFSTDADNLSDADNDTYHDVFVRDIDAGTTTFVSRASGASGASGNNFSTLARISGDGTRVAFSSQASTLGTPNAGFTRHVYVRDLGADQTILVSRASGANGAPGDLPSGGQPGIEISDDGTRVVFDSQANNFGDGSGGPANDNDVFMRDLTANTTQHVARAANGTPAPSSFWGAITGDGANAGFVTAAALVGSDTDGIADFYLRGLGGGSTPPPTPPPSGGGGSTLAPPAAPARVTLRGDAAFERGTANDLYLACTTLDLYLIDVLPAGRRVAVTGAADLRLAGQTVEILLDGKRVGTAVIGADGSFAARVQAPSKRKRATARYQARVGSTASQKLRLARRMVATTLTRSGANLVLRGVVNPPRARKQPLIAVDRFLSCRRREAVKVPKVKPDRRGRFAVRIKVPAGANAVLYRARTKVPARAGRPATKGTFTLPRAANVG